MIVEFGGNTDGTVVTDVTHTNAIHNNNNYVHHSIVTVVDDNIKELDIH